MSRGARFTKSWANECLARGRHIEGMNPNEELTEAELHELVRRECDRRGWIALHGDMSRPTGRTIGESDFCCLLPDGKVLFAECKTIAGRLSEGQVEMRARMAKLGHEMHVVRSFEEFLRLTARCLANGSGASSCCVTPAAGKSDPSSNADATAKGK